MYNRYSVIVRRVKSDVEQE